MHGGRCQGAGEGRGDSNGYLESLPASYTNFQPSSFTSSFTLLFQRFLVFSNLDFIIIPVR